MDLECPFLVRAPGVVVDFEISLETTGTFTKNGWLRVAEGSKEAVLHANGCGRQVKSFAHCDSDVGGPNLQIRVPRDPLSRDIECPIYLWHHYRGECNPSACFAGTRTSLDLWKRQRRRYCKSHIKC